MNERGEWKGPWEKEWDGGRSVFLGFEIFDSIVATVDSLLLFD